MGVVGITPPIGAVAPVSTLEPREPTAFTLLVAVGSPVGPRTALPIADVVPPLPISGCVTSLSAATVAARTTGVKLAAGASFGKKVKSDARALAVSGVMFWGAGMGPESVTVTR